MLPTVHQQTGFTITELLITLALSLGIVSSVLVGYLATFSSSMQTLAGSKLSLDLAALMNLMASDIRRAGYSGNLLTDPLGNPFNLPDGTTLEVFDSADSAQKSGPQGRGSCVVFAYDSDEDAVVDANELVGFRLSHGVVEMRTTGNLAASDSCTSSGSTWMALTDPDFITITVLDFNLAESACLNTREPDGVDNDGNGTIDNPEEYECYLAPFPAAGSRDITVETRQVTITLTGALTGDTFTRMSLAQHVRVRNDLVRQH